MKKQKDETSTASIDRRGFLRGVGVGAGAAGVAAVVGVSGGDEAVAAEADKTAAGYRETEHVRRVYELSRF